MYVLSFCILAPQTPTERTLYTQRLHDGRWAAFHGMFSLSREPTFFMNILNAWASESCSSHRHWTMLVIGFLWCLNTTEKQKLGYSESCASLEPWTIPACDLYGRNVNSTRNSTSGTLESYASLEQETIRFEVLAHIGFVVHVARFLFRLTPRSLAIYKLGALW